MYPVAEVSRDLKIASDIKPQPQNFVPNSILDALATDNESKKMKLILHLDVKQTITVMETSGAETNQSYTINRILSKRCFSNWSGNRLESYYDFIHYSSNGLNKDEKRQKVNNFMENARELCNQGKLSKESYETSEMELKMISQALCGSVVFPSVIKLIRQLSRSDLDFHIVLRTFGKDGDLVAAEIQKEIPGQKFNTRAKFKEKVLTIADEKFTTYTNVGVSDYFHSYLKSNIYNHAIIQDDYEYWQSHKESSAYGKPFPVDLKDENTIAMFADDNIETNFQTETNIIDPYDPKTRQPIPMQKLVDRKWVVQVDPYKAITNEDYYINAVEAAFQSVGKSFKSLEMVDVYYV